MSDIAIQVNDISKRYRIGLKKEVQDTFVGAFMHFVKRPVKNLQRLRNLSHFSENRQDPEDIIWALKDVSFEVTRGEVVGIIGRNGTGKSTLLKILARITEPTKGRAVVRGRVGALLEVGTGFHPELTGRENTYLNGTILGMKKAEIDRKFDDIVDFAEVEKFIDTPVKRYSSGMRVRLAFAVAAHLQPEILLVDEVLAVGDTAFQKKCVGKMGNIAKEGRTILFVSHRMASIRKLCKSVYWLDDGTIREIGPADEVVTNYEREVLYGANSQTRQQSVVVNYEHGVEVHRIHSFVALSKSSPTLRVEVRGRAIKPISRLGIGIQISTLDGIMVSRIGPSLAQSMLKNVHGNWEGIFEVKNITHYLSGGDYIIQIRVNRPSMGVILIIEDTTIIKVPLTDVHKSGIFMSLRRHGLVPLPVTFSHRNP
jgi:lipopolysaccharide transport system ATP-binding protein